MIRESAINMINALYEVSTKIDELQKLDILNVEKYPEVFPITVDTISIIEQKLMYVKHTMKIFFDDICSLTQSLIMKYRTMVTTLGGEDTIDKLNDLSNKGIIDPIENEDCVLSTFENDSVIKVIEVYDQTMYSCIAILKNLFRCAYNDIINIRDANERVYENAVTVINAILSKCLSYRQEISSPEFINIIQTECPEYSNEFKQKYSFDTISINAIKDGISLVFKACKAIQDNFTLYDIAITSYKKIDLQNLLPNMDVNIELC